MADRYLVDTSILIPFYNHRRFEESLLGLMEGQVLFSVVTINELIRGAHDDTSRNTMNDFIKAGREALLTPSEGQWIECARISESILRGKKRTKEGVLLLQNDILIALTARGAEATLVTCDLDFKILKDWIKVPVDFWT